MFSQRSRQATKIDLEVLVPKRLPYLASKRMHAFLWHRCAALTVEKMSNGRLWDVLSDNSNKVEEALCLGLRTR